MGKPLKISLQNYPMDCLVTVTLYFELLWILKSKYWPCMLLTIFWSVLMCLFVAVVSVDGQPVKLQLCDTAGQVSDLNAVFPNASWICVNINASSFRALMHSCTLFCTFFFPFQTWLHCINTHNVTHQRVKSKDLPGFPPFPPVHWNTPWTNESSNVQHIILIKNI